MTKRSHSEDILHFEAIVSAVVRIDGFRRNFMEFGSDVDEVALLLLCCLP
jgi:hypothetical protein